jgi:hypothetical protein
LSAEPDSRHAWRLCCPGLNATLSSVKDRKGAKEASIMQRHTMKKLITICLVTAIFSLALRVQAETATLHVDSSPGGTAGVSVFGDVSGTTPFSVQVQLTGFPIGLQATWGHGGMDGKSYWFSHWVLSGAAQGSGYCNGIWLAMTGDATARAVYKVQPILTVKCAPNLSVQITGTDTPVCNPTLDCSGSTPYGGYTPPGWVILTAPDPASDCFGNSHSFDHWVLNGVDQPSGQTTIEFSMKADTTAEAVYTLMHARYYGFMSISGTNTETASYEPGVLNLDYMGSFGQFVGQIIMTQRPSIDVMAEGQLSGGATAISQSGISYYASLTKKTPSAPDILVPMKVQTSGSAWAYPVADGNISSSVSLSLVIKRLCDTAVEVGVYASADCYHPYDEFVDRILSTAWNPGDVEVIQMSVNGTITSSSGVQGFLDPLITVDPDFMVNIDGNSVSAAELYGVEFSDLIPVPTLSVTPSDGLSSSGIQGGPFSPNNKAYTLTNTGGQALDWTAGKTQSWVTLDQTSGMLASGASTTVTVSINSNASSLSLGDYSDTVSFTNTTNGNGNATRSVALHVIAPGTIAGTVTKESDGTPIVGLWVEVLDYDTDEWSGGASTNSDGFYSIEDLPAGTYRVRLSTWNTDYIQEYYDNVFRYEQATPVTVPAANIDFSLEIGASISGVVRNPSGVPLANVQVDCWIENDDFGTGDTTDDNGFYKCRGLPVGFVYALRAYPPPDSDYVISQIRVAVSEAEEYAGNDITFAQGGLTVSGKVSDKATGSALANILVTYWNDDFEIWTSTYTDANGIYKLIRLLPGDVEIRAEPESYYAWIGTELNLTQDIDNLDFALAAGAILSGKVIDAETAQPLGVINGEYSNQRYAVWINGFTNADGTFIITNLPPGVAETKVKPNVDTGYAWSLPWPADMICLNEGEYRPNRIVALHKGALVSGYIKDPNGNPLSNFGCRYSGRLCDGWSEADITGRYEIRLPVGSYSIGSDEDGFSAVPKQVTITDVSQHVNVPDMIAYSEETGGQISGSVNNPGGYPKTGSFVIVAFEAGTIIDPSTWYTTEGPICQTELQHAGPFTITSLPQGVNYDVHLLVMSNTPDQIQSCALTDSVLNVPVGTTAINLYYHSQGSTVTGKATNARGDPVLGAIVLLNDSTTGDFAGFADTDFNGEYIIPNVPAGTYTATGVHSKYLSTSTTTVQIVDGIPANVSTIVVPFAGEKDGADLNGDGLVNMFDFTELANQWLRSGSLEADFTEDNLVDSADLTRMAENWLSNAIWYQE